MSFHIQVHKQSAEGEGITATITQHNPVTGEQEHTLDDMKDFTQEIFKVCDERMQEMGRRYLEVMQLNVYFEPHVWCRVEEMLQVLAGRLNVKHLIQRWQAAQEESQMYYQAQIANGKSV